jgi:predicted TIM-barrel fold metal-dependent hydrolase
MNKIALLIVQLLLIWSCAIGQDQDTIRMDFETYQPKSTLVVDENPVKKAKFPFVDIHSHHWRMATQDLSQLIEEMDSLNMKVIVNLSGRGGEALVGMMENVRNSGYEDRIVIFTNVSFNGIDDDDWTDNAVKQLEFDVVNGARGLKIYKSLGMSVEDSAGKRIAVDDIRLDPIWAKCGELGIPVLIHSADPRPFWFPHDEKNERWLELKINPRRKRYPNNPVSWETIISEQHNVFRKHPNTTFINAHFGWYANDLKKLGALMEEFPNMYVEVSANIAELGRQPRAALRFFDQYQDRILFGKDSYRIDEYFVYFRTLETEDEYFDYGKYHAFWRIYGLGLPDEIMRKVYYKNAVKIIPGLSLELFE